jgi:hydrophobic/amphiphilic exporter-1 (mainly G- bacteria), HAE1 family
MDGYRNELFPLREGIHPLLRADSKEEVPAEAAKKTSRLRFRAILLTSLTTIRGLLPLLKEKSLQAQVLIPLVTSIVFGMLASTVLVLLVVPVLYAILGEVDKTHY